ncbi:putative type VI secretion system effector [Acinetobacter haemolyticus]|uniref:putative type VI secretion system effector n=1 Tax=Acinetobacter haemolyticus TaxID=29430 RepID=UPI002A6B083E|nr:putative type VI secretion system effector [Acinetobacter haemolyticus]WPO66431.1 putative type VI secretion system effector [Acinetobacter haemolyticus]
MLKFEGCIQRLEVYDDSLSAFGKSGDAQITSSAILSGVTESISLSAQTVFLASRSRLHVKSVILEINGRICVGQFHRALFEEGEYVVCVVKRLENNLYELYSVLSPKTGLLHMQVGMGASVKTHDASVIKGGRVWYGMTIIITSLIVFLARGINMNTLLILAFVSILFYFILLFIIKNAAHSIKHLSEKSEQIFGLYGFKDPKEVFLLPSRYLSEKDHLLLEAVFEYRKVIKEDPYPESYIERKERNV